MLLMFAVQPSEAVQPLEPAIVDVDPLGEPLEGPLDEEDGAFEMCEMFCTLPIRMGRWVQNQQTFPLPSKFLGAHVLNWLP